MSGHSVERQPPLIESGVFAVSGSSLIDAPKEKIWDIMMNFPEYGQWNTFVRKITLSPPYPEPYTVSSPPTKPVLDAHLSIIVRMPPGLSNPTFFTKGTAFVRICALDEANFRVAWETPSFPKWLLHAERWQWLEEVEIEVPVEGEGASATRKKKMVRYRNQEVFNGFAAYFVKLFVGSKLKEGFQAAADTLKTRAENK
ncbi:hypothetical protein CVT24_007256 [Panaeolus cyanescens]|uniref:Coenzyme Q-binding protein COQ10 START domain-containing protein n=1 Tax=Panaeolus cyanescens TaxID=181874 RepID=A0A409W5L6_9AGAR|nr:hypothetical protein CVT24_007256 [Panaeolus cyanescens]